MSRAGGVSAAEATACCIRDPIANISGVLELALHSTSAAILQPILRMAAARKKSKAEVPVAHDNQPLVQSEVCPVCCHRSRFDIDCLQSHVEILE